MTNNFMTISLYHYLVLAIILFFIGLWGVIISKNIIKVLICVEFMLTSININFTAFAGFLDKSDSQGLIFALFYIAIGAIELAIALYIFYLMYNKKQTPNIEELNKKDNK